jgi:NMD protein affecting ribosome stability and mRNA decay
MQSKSSLKRNDRLIKERRKDTYKNISTIPEHAVCKTCGATFFNGHWTWKQREQHFYETICPACKRTEDNYPAGLIEIKGKFYNEHSDEISNLIKNTEKLEKNERPLERIMFIRKEIGRIIVTTTGIHIARRIGEALKRSYQGLFSFQYGEGDKSIRVVWERQ